MRHRFVSVLIASACVCVSTAGAQVRPDSTVNRRPTQPTTGRVQASTPSTTPNRDVILEVPELSVDSIGLTVSNVKAHVSLDANAMNLVQITAGVDVGIKKVQLGIVGVYGEVPGDSELGGSKLL